MRKLYGFTFVLEEFAQNVSHVSRKTYFTHGFFTDRQVYAAVSGIWQMQEKWEHFAVPNTLAVPQNGVVKKSHFFSTISRRMEKSNKLVGSSYYLLDGHQEYLAPGNVFVAFSFEPPPPILFIGKKGCLARVDTVEEVEYRLARDSWTTMEMLYFVDYQNMFGSEIVQMNLSDASQRFLVGRFKCRETLTVKFLDKEYSYFSLARYLKEEERRDAN